MVKIMRYFLLILFSTLLFSACQKPENQTASAEAKRYALRGKVVAVDKAKKKANIAHDEVPGYMPAMTMDFPIKDDWVFDELSKDAEVRGDLVVDKDGFWLESTTFADKGRCRSNRQGSSRFYFDQPRRQAYLVQGFSRQSGGDYLYLYEMSASRILHQDVNQFFRPRPPTAKFGFKRRNPPVERFLRPQNRHAQSLERLIGDRHR
jgi:Cu/Ag efflux protein CusF